MEKSKLPFCYWLMFIHLLTSTKKTFSASELQRQIGHKGYESIWYMLHKLRLIMGKRDSEYQISKYIELDDAFFEVVKKGIKQEGKDRENVGRSKREVKVLVAVESEPQPRNVDIAENFFQILEAFEEIQKHLKIIFPIHPRTKNNITKMGLMEKINSLKNLKIILPSGYLYFLQLEQNAKFIMTDSSGLQEESTYLQIPYLTLRENTEHPEIEGLGTNKVVGIKKDIIIENAEKIILGNWKKGQIPQFWGGHAAERIVKVLRN